MRRAPAFGLLDVSELRARSVFFGLNPNSLLERECHPHRISCDSLATSALQFSQ